MTVKDLNKRKKTTADLCQEYNKSQITIWRWEKSGVLPRADRINGRKYWDWDVKPKLDEGEAA